MNNLIVFRGTVPDKIANVIVDAVLFPVKLDPIFGKCDDC